MTRKKNNRTTEEIKAMKVVDGAQPLLCSRLFLEAEMSEAIGGAKGRTKRRALELSQRLLLAKPDYTGMCPQA